MMEDLNIPPSKPGWMTAGWWRFRLMEVGAAAMIVIGILYVGNLFNERQRDLTPPGSWFRVNDLYVPDHEQGTNPEIIYDRIVDEPFQAFWVVEVQREEPGGLFSLHCQGSGVNDYEPMDYIPENKVTWEWFIGKPCVVPPGNYRLRASWTMRKPGWPEKVTVRTSNLFRVTL
jgi:hypothetical protein